MTWRVILSVIVFAVWGVLADMWRTTAAIVSGQAAVLQLNDSNVDTIAAVTTMHHINGPQTIISVIALAVLFFTWFSFVKNKLKVAKEAAKVAGLALAVFIGTVAYSNQSYAYYTTDANQQQEFIQIGSNDSCFFIPMTGANKTTQAQFNSEAYLNDTAQCDGTSCTGHGKVPTKRVEIPHVQIVTNGIANRNYWISSAQLQCVNRTPVNREWVSSANRGTSAKDQGFRFETADSADVSTGIVISAFVKEEDAAKFLYWFGTKPKMDGSEEEKKYASILFSRSLDEVVDDNVHRSVQECLAREFGAVRTKDAPAAKATIIAKCQKEVTDKFAAKGITIDTLGYAEGLTWGNQKIQQAFDDVFVAGKDAESANLRMPLVDYQMKLAQISVVNAQAAAINNVTGRWNGQLPALPSWMIVSDGIVNWARDTINNLTTGKPAAKP